MPFDVSPLTVILFLVSMGLMFYGLSRREDEPRRDSRRRNGRR